VWANKRWASAALAVLTFLTPVAGQSLRPPKSEDEEVVKVGVDLVTVNVSVTDRGKRPVGGLAAADFNISDEGRAVNLDFFESQGPTSLVFVVDTSTSMKYEKWGKLQAALKKFLSRARDGNDYTLVAFSDRPRLVSESVGAEQLWQSVQALKPDGNTALYDAMLLGLEALGRAPHRHRALILLSDGEDSASRAALEDVRSEALARRATVYTVGITRDLFPKFRPNADELKGREILKRLASATGGLSFFPEPDGISRVLEGINTDLNAQYTLGYYAVDKAPGWRNIQLSLGPPARRRLQLRYPQRYLRRSDDALARRDLNPEVETASSPQALPASLSSPEPSQEKGLESSQVKAPEPSQSQGPEPSQEKGSDLPILKQAPLPTALAASVAAPIPAGERGETQQPGNEQVSITTAEVQVDLVVKDKKYRLVRDLEPGDIEVYEDGVRQELRSLRLVVGEAAGGADTSRTQGAAPANTAAEAGGLTLKGNTVALIFDRLSPGARKLAYDAALAYAENSKSPDDSVGVFATGLSLSVVQQYTKDAVLVRAAIDKVGTQADAFSSGGKSNREQARDITDRLVEVDRSLEGLTGRAGDEFVALKTEQLQLQTMRRTLESFETMERTLQGRATATALLAIINSMRELPGRKAVLFFSEGVAIPADVQALFRSVIATANRAGVSIYAVDAAGLRVESARAETRKEINARSQLRMERLNEASLEGPMTKDLERNEDILRLSPESGMTQLADQTGGFLVRDTNDLKGRMAQIDQDMSAYYLISYAPKQHENDGRFHSIEVKLKRSGLIVQARKGYFAVDPTLTTPVLEYEAPAVALAGSGSRPRDIAVRAAALSFPEPARPGLAAVIAEVPASAVTFSTDAKKKQYATDFTILTLIRDARRQVVKKLSRQYRLSGPLAGLDAARQSPVLFYGEAELEPGEYTVEAVVYDSLNKRAGVSTARLEVPVTDASTPQLSSVSLVERAERLSPAEQKGENPFRNGELLIYPNLDEAPRVKAGGQLPFFFTVYQPAGKADVSPKVSLELLRGGQPIGRMDLPLPRPDAQGRIQYAGALPLDKIGEGSYELKVVLSNGQRTVSRSLRFAVTAATQ
jgi:VWFA-related protein